MEINIRLFEKYSIMEQETRFETEQTKDLIWCWWLRLTATSPKRPAQSPRAGYRVGLLRPSRLAFPYAAVQDLARRVQAFLSVEMSMGQLVTDIR